MKAWIAKLQKGYGRKLHSLHAWNGWIVTLLMLSGLILLAGFWRGVLGEGRVWIKWAHIYIGILSILPVFYYLFLAGKHWKQLKKKPWQRFNVLVVLGLLLGWFGSGMLLWQFRAVGPAWSNPALTVHDLLTWVGLPYIIYHSISRAKWLKEPQKRTVKSGRENEGIHPASKPQAVYSRQTFLRFAIGAVLIAIFGPSFLKWIGTQIGGSIGGGGAATADLVEQDANHLVPAPTPLPASLPPAGGGSTGRFRIYTVTQIPKFDNSNWSFTIDGLVEKPQQYDWKSFLELKRTVQVSDFHCVTGWSVYNNTWEGIPLKQMLAQAGVQNQAQFVKFYSGDGVYTDSLNLEQARMDDVMVALLHDGQQIPSDLGGPVRLIVPKMYTYKSVKWLTRIELIAEDHTGFWEERGYSKDAWV